MNDKFQANPVVGFFHGIDPATKGDYYTDIVHVLTQKPQRLNEEDLTQYKWLPFLCGIMRLKNRDPNEIIDLQIKMFNKFPPMRAKIDASREDFLTNALVRKYGETTILPVKFLNTGASNTKFHLKQIGYSYLNAGYQWPNEFEIEKTSPKFAKLLRILKKEMMHEQVETTDSGRVTFKHPIGKHNDMVHGWELSLDAVMTFQQKNLGYEKIKSQNQIFDTQQQSIYEDYPSEEIEPDEDYETQGSSFAMK